MRYLLMVAAALMIAPLHAADAPPGSDEAFKAAFRCPETLANDAERNRANEDFSAWIHAHHPGWSLQQILDFRAGLLSSHGCQTAMTRVPGSDEPSH